MSYLKNRESAFKEIQAQVEEDTYCSSSNSLVLKGDSLDILKKLPSSSVSLILTDPPYHATKKKNIYGDTRFKKDESYLKWMREYAIEWKRILKPNGSLFCFCDSSLSARLEIMFSEFFNVLSHIVWTKPNQPGFDGWKGKMRKESLRQWYAHSERIIFLEPALDGNLHRSPFANILKEARTKSGLSGHKLTEMVGAYGKVNHGGAVSNWEAGRNTPSREQYEKIREAILSTGKVSDMPCYEDAIRPFFMDKNKQFTDVWDFPSVKQFKGKHPAEKPITMLKHAIEATTYEGDIVLDCFGGSGSTLLASIETNRRAISIEIEDKWLFTIAKKLQVQCNLDKDKFFISRSLSDLQDLETI